MFEALSGMVDQLIHSSNFALSISRITIIRLTNKSRAERWLVERRFCSFSNSKYGFTDGCW